LESGDPFGGGGEQDPVSCLGGSDREPDREVGLAGAWWSEQDHVLGLGQKGPGGEVGDQVAFEGRLVVEDEVLDRLGRPEPGGPDPQPGAGGVTG
jgi:hypothetical protein